MRKRSTDDQVDCTAPIPKMRKGLWSPEEDDKLLRYMLDNGHGCWSDIARNAGLLRCGKSCRLRWINYLSPDLKRGSFSPQEERLIVHFHGILGNRWSQIAAHLPGRTDNEIKNFWNSTLNKRLKATSSLNESGSPDPRQDYATSVMTSRSLPPKGSDPSNNRYKGSSKTSPPVPVSIHHCGSPMLPAIQEWSGYDDLGSIMSPSAPGKVKLEESILGSSEMDAPPTSHLSNSSGAGSTAVSINSRINVKPGGTDHGNSFGGHHPVDLGAEPWSSFTGEEGGGNHGGRSNSWELRMGEWDDDDLSSFPFLDF
ncbi:hypothetical protein MLD38_038259 [Melastoma candidum]|uniref:Uncharacterized protein n=1 Tax=Melastoma candidum TaxID=119954 RepID=A0ACB9KZ76_9MYRT|nr:hypothetical protein MLD38_038259 [Melastoma candidum]